MLKTPMMLSYPRAKLSRTKQLNRSKAISQFLELNWKNEDDFGNSIGDKTSRSTEMKSKFQREQRTIIVFQKQKERQKYQIFRKIH